MKLLAPAQDGVIDPIPGHVKARCKLSGFLSSPCCFLMVISMCGRVCFMLLALFLVCQCVRNSSSRPAVSFRLAKYFFFHYYSLEIFGFHHIVLISFVSKGRHIPESFYYIISLFCFVLFCFLYKR